MSYVVLIQIHDEAEKLFRCLQALANQTQLPQKVIIVDDGTPNTSIYDQYTLILRSFGLTGMEVEYARAAVAKQPNLDTVGKAILYIWKRLLYSKDNYDFLSILDVDSFPETTYYEKLIAEMSADPNLVCASGVIQVNGIKEELISAKVIKRTDARGSGKIIRTDFLANISLTLFPEVAWDTWINVKAKLARKKTLQIPEAILYSDRTTTRLAKGNNFRDGRLTYHFGYNPLLLGYKILFRGKDIWKGYCDAKKNNWVLPDPEVRSWFGWKYLFHFWR